MSDPGSHNRVARKSTASSSTPTSSYATRSQVAASQASASQASVSKQPVRHTRSLRRAAAEKFLENLNAKTYPPGALYDENGVHIATGIDMCDCLIEGCVGCFFDCEKCGSPKCSIECRVHRKFIYDQIEYHGYDIVVKNPLLKH